MTTELTGKKVLVTGGEGFLGKYLVRELTAAGAEVSVFRHSDDPHVGGDLTRWDHVEGLCSNLARWGCDIVFHLAGWNGGIAFNKLYPADIFAENTMMAMNVLQGCAAYGIKKVVSTTTSCAYGDAVEYPEDFASYDRQNIVELAKEGIMEEVSFLRSRPNPTVACHGYAKRNLQLASRFFSQQYEMNAVCACLTTLYGPGDSFDPQRTKVMGGMVKRFVDAADAHEQEVVCWGTGAALREFLYVEDCAKRLLQVATHYQDSTIPINLGSGQEITIKTLAEIVKTRVPYVGNVIWDNTKPDGQLRKRLDISRQSRFLPNIEFTPLELGIDRTIAYYRGMKR